MQVATCICILFDVRKDGKSVLLGDEHGLGEGISNITDMSSALADHYKDQCVERMHSINKYLL